MKYTELPPHAPSLMESTRAIGYSIESAIADIIDNSIAAGATKVDINFFPVGQSYISILDNGCGMDNDKLIQAMQYGSQSPLDLRRENDLGRYGLGMKTASLSQCRVLTVLSKKTGEVFGAQWNLDHVTATGIWSLILLEDNDMTLLPCFEKMQKIENGTLIIWQELDKFAVGERDMVVAFSRKMNLIREHISLVFHRYLSGEKDIKKLEVRMNDLTVQPRDPFMIKKSTQLMDEESINVCGEKVTVKAYILPHISKLTAVELKDIGGKEGLRKLQGFYVYRNKRLLIWGTWFRLMRQGELSKLARVQVDIPNTLDDLWTLDIKKSTAVPPEEVRRNLNLIIEKISNGSKRTWSYRGKKEIGNDFVHVWNRTVSRNGGIVYEINTDHLLVKSIIDMQPELRRPIINLLKQIGLSLPLNSLYIDLTNDEKLVSESDLLVDDIIDLAKSIVSACHTEDEKIKIFEVLKLTEPFSAFTDELDYAKERGDFRD